MTDRELENKIRKAVYDAVPDRLDAILSQCTIDRLNVSVPGPLLPFSFSRIILDVNPSVSLEVDDQENVIAADPLNDDAKELLAGLSLKGMPLRSAVDAIVEAMVGRGYLSEISNSILVSVQNADTKKQEELKDQVSRMVEDIMNKSLGSTEEGASVISQTITEDDNLAELAGEYGISEGKAALIQKVVNSDRQSKAEHGSKGEALTFDDLVSMSVNDIALLAEEEKMYDNTVTRVGTPSARAYIGHREALNRALSYAGLDMSQVYGHKVKLSCKKGMMVYKVRLRTFRGKIKYLIDARTGNMVRCRKNGRGKKKYWHKKYKYYNYNCYGGRRYNMGKNYNYNYNAYENVPMPEGVIGEEQAKQAALNHAGVTEDECLYVYCHPEIDHGRVEHYDVKFVANGMKYKYAIGLYDGAVLGRGVKDKRMKTGYVYEGNYHEHMAPPMGPAAGAPQQPMQGGPAPMPQQPVCQDGVCEIPQPGPAPAQGMPQTPPPVMPQNMTGDMISEDDALNIALSHAGLTLNDIYRWRIKLLNKHGRLIYRTKLKVMGYEYEIDVDAYNGAITKAHKEVDF